MAWSISIAEVDLFLRLIQALEDRNVIYSRSFAHSFHIREYTVASELFAQSQKPFTRGVWPLLKPTGRTTVFSYNPIVYENVSIRVQEPKIKG
jgi:hypothetical protein